MKSLHRRLWAFATASTLLAGCYTTTHTVGTGPSFKGPAGLQLYSLRANFTKTVPATLDIVKGYGIQEVELAGTYGQTPEQFRKELTARGLTPIAAHFSFDKLRDDPEGVAREAQTLGLKYAGCAWIPHQGSFDAPQARTAVGVFNHAGEILAKYGIKCFYHCHGYEFEPGAAGPNTTAMDILLRETNPKNVVFEMDVLWVAYPGQAPEKWLNNYPGRWELMHLKDYRKGLPTGIHTGKTDPNNDVTLGTGQMNWPVILAAARRTGVKHYFIEDESADAVNQVPQSLRYLEQIRF